MRFVYEERKAAQAAAILLQLNGGNMYYLQLIKLLYLADRQSLIETGYPITGDKMVSMDRGPVLSHLYSGIMEGTPEHSEWHQSISDPSAYQVRLEHPPGDEALSDYEIGLLKSIFETYGQMDRWALVRFTHDLPEWVDPDGSSIPIDVRIILREAGKSDEEIVEIASQAEAIWSFKNVTALIS